MVDPKTGNSHLIEPSENPERIIESFLKQAKKPNSLLWAMDELVKQDWQKWESVRRELWAMLEELDKLGY